MADLLDIAHQLADIARPIALHYFRNSGLSVEHKDDATPVTIADKEIEHEMRALLARVRPQDGIFGEEEGRTNENAEYTWILDPIDGTKAFTVGRPNFGSLIAVHHKTDGIVLGLCDIPPTKDRWWSVKNGDSFWNGKTVQARKTHTIADAIFSSTDPLRVPEPIFKLIKAVKDRAKIAVYGGDCLNFGLLASGFIDILIDGRQQLYDVAPFVPLIENAGGKITQFNGNPIDFNMDDRVLACSTPELHAEVLKLYKEVNA